MHQRKRHLSSFEIARRRLVPNRERTVLSKPRSLVAAAVSHVRPSDCYQGAGRRLVSSAWARLRVLPGAMAVPETCRSCLPKKADRTVA